MLTVSALIAIPSAGLLLVTAAGRIAPARAADRIPRGFLDHPVAGRQATIWRVEALDRGPGESDEAFVLRVFSLLAGHMVHFADATSGRVPLPTNWLLFALGFGPAWYFRNYEFHDGYRALARGFGLCSQMALVTWFFLRRAGVAVSVVRLQAGSAGHVVNEVELPDGRRWTLDLDYGRVMREPLTEVAREPALIDATYDWPDSVWGNATWRSDLHAVFASRPVLVSEDQLLRRLRFEQLTFGLAWLLPALGLALAVALA